MQLILLSGGSGQRLWPLSAAPYSKQFLPLFTPPKAPDAEPISMLQRIWMQIEESKLASSAMISTSIEQAPIINQQLGFKAPLILEPTSRNTYPAILLTCLYLSCVKKISPNEAVIIMPVDTYVDIDFFEHLKKLEQVIISTSSDLVLVGIKPTAPSEKYGYIVPASSTDLSKGFEKVLSFMEKPPLSKAHSLIKSGALWNAGVFGFKLDFMLTHIKHHALPTTYDTLLQSYNALPKISFDYRVVESNSNLMVTTYNGAWQDLGTFNTLTEHISNPITGLGLMSSDCTNTHIINHLDLPICALGVSDLVIVATSQGLLVSTKAASPRVKEVTSCLNSLTPAEEDLSLSYDLSAHSAYMHHCVKEVSER